MTNSSGGESAILFQNEGKTVFLLDIPHSIALAQGSSPNLVSPKHKNPSALGTSASEVGDGQRGRRRYLISAPPRQEPHPSTEPKSPSARARVLQRIPVTERRFHEEFIQPMARSALEEIRNSFQSDENEWCLPRRVLDAEQGGKRKWEQGNPSQQLGPSARDTASQTLLVEDGGALSEMAGPPVILSSRSVNAFESVFDLDGVVKNPSSQPAFLTIGPSEDNHKDGSAEYIVPPHSTFLLCTLPLAEDPHVKSIAGIPTDQKFNLILLDPPWPNRSVWRSSHYEVHPYAEMASCLQDILRVHTFDQPDHLAEEQTSDTSLYPMKPRAQSQVSLAAIWITNSEKARRTAYEALTTAGFQICEEWIWIKVTADGQPISPLDGLWRRPYEILVIGRKGSPVYAGDKSPPRRSDLLGIDPSTIKRRVIAAVPDLHSRKPNLKAVFEDVFFKSRAARVVDSYSALEVFARNLTAGWWACGNEVLKFNARECWIEEKT